MDSKPLDDEAAVAAEPTGVDAVDAMNAYIFKARAQLNAEAFANEKRLKGLYVDWVFDKLNLVKYR